MWRELALIAAVAGCGRIGFGELSSQDAEPAASLAVTPPPMINPGARVQLTPSGGVPPYTFEVLGGGGFVDTAGTFTAPSRAGSSTLAVMDGAASTVMTDVTYAGSTLFTVGGIVAGNPVTTVWSSTNGTSWNVVGALPSARANGNLIAFDDRLLYLGGVDATTQTDSILASTDGVAWTQIGTLPDRVVSSAATVHAGSLWLLCGYDGSVDYNQVYRSEDGVTWVLAGTFPVARHEHDVISRDDLLVVLGGHATATTTQDDIRSSPDGATWTTSTTRLAFATDFQGVGELGDRVVRSCGVGCNDIETSTDLVNWQVGTIPGERDGPTVIGFGGRFLLFGGGALSILESTNGVSWTAATAVFPAVVSRGSTAQFTPR
jgi:hypothetical protein